MKPYEVISTDEYKRFKEKYFTDIIGLDSIIIEFFSIYVSIEINKLKVKQHIPVTKQALNMIFYGNPGTGKTSIARKVAKMFQDLNYLSKGHLLEIDRSDLIGEYVGQTTVKTKNILEEAKGGVLFIDEAYSLYNDEVTDFGNEAIDIILKFVEDHHDDIIVILAGYKEKIEVMLANNKGLNSRFPIKICFEDYSTNQLRDIFLKMIQLNGYFLTKTLDQKWEKYLHFLGKNNDELLKYNGRFIRNTVEKIIRNHDLRLFLSKNMNDSLQTLSEEDFEWKVI